MHTGWSWAVPLWYAVFAWAWWPEVKLVLAARRSPQRRGGADGGSFDVIVWAMWVAIGLAILATRVHRFSMAQPRAAFVVGLALLVTGSLLRRHCFRVLGQWFTGVVQVRGEQPVVEAGAYRWVRHPSYGAGILLSLGIGCSFSNWLSLASLGVLTTAAYAYRIHVEERALATTLGDRYVAYMARTKRVVPFLV